MKFYELRPTSNEKIVGSYPQAETAKHNCDVWDDPEFIGNFRFEKIEIEPIISNAILTKKAVPTDIISTPSMGFTNRLLISSKLKKIISENASNKCQFFHSPVIYKNDFLFDYWIVHPYKFSFENIDFEKSSFVLRKRKTEGGTYLKDIEVNSLEEFHEILNLKEKSTNSKFGSFSINNIVLKKKTSDDFFVLRFVQGGLKYVISEKLMNKITEDNLSGIDFIPIEMKLHE